MKTIKHLRISKVNGKNDSYLCNRAVSITIEKCDKSVWDKKDVTCKNCLRILNGKPFYIQRKKYVIQDKNLLKELKELLTSGWSEREIKTEWEGYLEEEVKPYFPIVYKLLKEEV